MNSKLPKCIAALEDSVKPLNVCLNKAFSSEKMQKVNLFETENLFCDVYCLQPGQAQKPHHHSGADKIYYVLEGTATIQVGEEEESLGPGNIVLAPSGSVHGVRNASQENLTLLVMMAPNPNVKKAV
jgi:mannose-6-phosphate isomerase-like protein (cupin superfamily)